MILISTEFKMPTFFFYGNNLPPMISLFDPFVLVKVTASFCSLQQR